MSHNWHSSPTMSSVLVCQSIPKFGYLAWHRHLFLHSEAGLQHDSSLTPLLRVHYTQLHSVFQLLRRVRAIFVYYISENGGPHGQTQYPKSLTEIQTQATNYWFSALFDSCAVLKIKRPPLCTVCDFKHAKLLRLLSYGLTLPEKPKWNQNWIVNIIDFPRVCKFLIIQGPGLIQLSTLVPVSWLSVEKHELMIKYRGWIWYSQSKVLNIQNLDSRHRKLEKGDPGPSEWLTLLHLL